MFQAADVKQHTLSGGPDPSRSHIHKNDNGANRLCGAQRVSTKPFHLAGISLECTVSDVVSYCRQRRVVITGCYMIRTRMWGTQSAKIFVSDNCSASIMKVGSWPEFVRCRLWECDPPKRVDEPSLLQ